MSNNKPETNLAAEKSSDKIRHLANLYNKELQNNQRKALALALDRIQEAEDQGDIREYISAHNDAAYSHLFAGFIKEALKYAAKAMRLSNEYSYSKGKAYAYLNLGIINNIRSHHSQGLFCLNHALDLFLRLNLKRESANTLANMGNVYTKLGNYSKAAQKAYEAVKIYDEIGHTEGKSSVLNNLGCIYMDHLRDASKALPYYEQALEINISLSKKSAIALSYSNIGTCYQVLEDYKKALSYFKKALSIRQEMGDNLRISNVFFNLCEVYFAMENLDEAYRYLMTAIDMETHIGSKFKMAKYQINLSKILLYMGKLDEALKFGLEGKKITEENNIVSLQKYSHRFLSEIYAAMGEWEKAYQLHLKFHEQEIEETKESAAEKFDIMKLKFDMEQKEKENEIIKLKNIELTGKNEQISAQKKQLEILNNELHSTIKNRDKLFSIIAHDLRGPLQAISGYSELLKFSNGDLSKKDELDYTGKILDSVGNLSSLLNNLLDWSRAQTGHLNILPEAIYFEDVIVSILNYLDSSIKKKEIQVEYNIPPELKLMADKNMIETVFRNLLSNSLKFTNNKGLIQIRAENIGDKINISVIDNGIGIDKEILEIYENTGQLLQRTGTRGEKGTGLGLSICRDFIEAHKGRMNISSEKGAGTVISITLPKAE